MILVIVNQFCWQLTQSPKKKKKKEFRTDPKSWFKRSGILSCGVDVWRVVLENAGTARNTSTKPVSLSKLFPQLPSLLCHGDSPLLAARRDTLKKKSSSIDRTMGQCGALGFSTSDIKTGTHVSAIWIVEEKKIYIEK